MATIREILEGEEFEVYEDMDGFEINKVKNKNVYFMNMKDLEGAVSEEEYQAIYSEFFKDRESCRRTIFKNFIRVAVTGEESKEDILKRVEAIEISNQVHSEEEKVGKVKEFLSKFSEDISVKVFRFTKNGFDYVSGGNFKQGDFLDTLRLHPFFLEDFGLNEFDIWVKEGSYKILVENFRYDTELVL